MPRGQYEVTNLRYQPRLWDSYPTKSPNLRHHQTRSQNKNRAEVAGCGPAHPQPEAGRRGQPELEGGNCVQREASSTKLQAGFIANQDFLGFWTVDIPLRRCAGYTPRKLSSRDGGGDKSQRPCSPNTWVSELLRPRKGTNRRPNRVCAFVEYPST